MQTVGILSYGVGNIGSMLNMLKRAGVKTLVISEPQQLLKVDRVILPGVGSFDGVKSKLVQSGLLPDLQFKVLQEKMPILGICVGMQIMFDESEEGSLAGLGWLSGKIVRFSVKQKIKIPHVGWNEINWQKNLEKLEPFARYYFTHSYYAALSNQSISMATCVYGNEFVVAVQKENITAVQFHPEKSHKNGMNFLQLFSSGALDS